MLFSTRKANRFICILTLNIFLNISLMLWLNLSIDKSRQQQKQDTTNVNLHGSCPVLSFEFLKRFQQFTMPGSEVHFYLKPISTVCYATLLDAKWNFKSISICMFLIQQDTFPLQSSFFMNYSYPFAHLSAECILHLTFTINSCLFSSKTYYFIQSHQSVK